MRRALVTLGLVGLVAGATGCGKGAVQEPEAPTKSFTQTEAPRRHERPLPRLIAPPPAYGNKVVMARGSSSSALN
jgi:hypothetical protein